MDDIKNNKGNGSFQKSNEIDSDSGQIGFGISHMDEPGKFPPINNIDFILDVPLEITVELGRTKLLICDLLKLGQGSVIELTKIAGDTLEILANNKLIAKGEVVVLNEKYGIRLTEVISPVERIEKLK